MHDIKQILAIAVREARTELGLSQEKLAETLNMDTRTILNIEAGRGNPKYDKLYPLMILPQLSVFAFLYYRTYSIINISKNMGEAVRCQVHTVHYV